jgi:hypothetical protein
MTAPEKCTRISAAYPGFPEKRLLWLDTERAPARCFGSRRRLCTNQAGIRTPETARCEQSVGGDRVGEVKYLI